MKDDEGDHGDETFEKEQHDGNYAHEDGDDDEFFLMW